MKRIILLVFGLILLVLIPVLAGATPAAPAISEFDVIVEAADDYLNAPTTVWNMAEKDLCSNLLDRNPDNDPFILSIRASDIYALGHVPGAVNIPMAEV